MNESNATHHPSCDQWFKALADACLELAGEVTLEEVVHVPPEQALAVYRGYETRIRQESAEEGALQEAQSTLFRLLTRRFSALPEDALARILGADHATLERWVAQVLAASRSRTSWPDRPRVRHARARGSCS